MPWSMWPIVPTLTCGLVRSKVALAILIHLHLRRALTATGIRPASARLAVVRVHTRGYSTTSGSTGHTRFNKDLETFLAWHPTAGRHRFRLRRPAKTQVSARRPRKLLMGFEPMTSSLPRRRSTTELQQRFGPGLFPAPFSLSPTLSLVPHLSLGFATIASWG